MAEAVATIAPLNAFLRELHGATDNVGETMQRLVPFPVSIGSLPDAELISFALKMQRVSDGECVDVQVEARYATSARVRQVADFYHREFARVGSASREPIESSLSDGITLEAQLLDHYATRYRVTAGGVRGYRSVKVAASYVYRDSDDLLGRLAEWHVGLAPVVAGSEPTAVEVATFAKGRLPETTVLYSTSFACAATSLAERRAFVDQALEERGWTYIEPRDGILFVSTGKFDAEIHLDGNAASSALTFVGEFQLR